MDEIAPNQELVNLITMFDKLMGAWESEYRRNSAMRASWGEGAEKVGYKSVEELVPFLATNPNNLTTEQMTALALGAQMKEYYPGGMLDSSILRRANYYKDLMVHDFDNEPEAKFEIRKYREDNISFDITLSGYHYLKNRLEYQSGWNFLFYEVFLPEMDEQNGKKTKFPDAIQAFPDWLTYKGFDLDNGHDFVGGGYTYNNENLLNQAFVWDTIYVDGIPEEFEKVPGLEDGYITIIQIHIGVDARGGFSDPAVYSSGWGFPCDMDQATIGCTECRAWWDYNQYTAGGLDSDEYPSLKDFSVYNFEEWQEMLDEQGEPPPVFGPMYSLPGFEDLPTRPEVVGDIDPATHPIILDENEDAICPICGKGHLIAQAPYAEG